MYEDEGEAIEQSHITGWDSHPEIHHLESRPSCLLLATLSV